LDAAQVEAGDVGFGVETDSTRGTQSRVIQVGPYTLGDTIDTGSMDVIRGSAGSDVIRIEHDQLNAISASNPVNRSISLNGAAFTNEVGTANPENYKIEIAAVVDGGDGDDFIEGGDLGNNLFGGNGNDVLFGGRLDDWLFGGAGSDVLDACL
jgi:trimeric autotransporter adhesin